MDNKKESYRYIFKTTGLFGGVEGFKIIIGVVQAKVVAVLLGAVGIGIQGLFTTAINMISALTSLGLRTSAVRDIAEANATNDKSLINKTIITLRRWVWFSGIVGTFVTLAMAPLLSQWTFGNKNYTWAFIWLSIIMLFNSLSNGQLAMMQGMRRLTDLAKASLYGTVLGLLSSLPLFYWLGIAGIVPAMIITAFSTLFFSWYFAKKIIITQETITFNESYHLGTQMAKLGFFLMLSSFLSLLFSYAINTYISRTGGLVDVGLYRAGFLIATYYVGVVFSAMGADYLPRLSVASKDNVKTKEIANQQGEIAILIIAPLVVSLITLVPLIIKILYSRDFLKITDFITWAVISMLFRAGAWCMSYIMLARGRALLFFITEVSTGLFFLICNIFGYKYFGLPGLGMAYLLCYIVYFIMHYLIDKKLFQFSFSRDFVKLFLILNLVCFGSFILYKIIGHPWMYFYGSLITIIVGIYSFHELNKRIGFSEIFSVIRSKINNKKDGKSN